MTITNDGPVKRKKKIMIIAGEPSGDLHGSALVAELLRKYPSLKIIGIGGDMMAMQGMELFYHIKYLSAMGLVEVLLQIRRIKEAFDLFRRHLSMERPDLLILIDYPGFNLKAAAYAKRKGVPVLYYVAPKVWAWKKSRLAVMKKNVDHVALIFPFEERIYKKAGISATFVGNPLLDDTLPVPLPASFQTSLPLSPSTDVFHGRGLGAEEAYPLPPSTDLFRGRGLGAEEAYPLPPSTDLSPSVFNVGILPGSRPSEIAALLETMLDACMMIYKKHKSVHFMVSLSPSIELSGRSLALFSGIIHQYLQREPFHSQPNLMEIVPGPVKEIFPRCDLLVAASGTVTLEAAIAAVPMIIVYKVSPVTAFFARCFLEISHVGLPNIVAGYELVPELIQDMATPEQISGKALGLIQDKFALDHIRRGLYMLKNRLGIKRNANGSVNGAARGTASIAISMISGHPQ
ncbi:MAG: hypothetical protein HQK66_10160 [Desulfamplus sp.]|nr:hypothetical protein [Desulfamplus sp.]